MPLGLEKLGYAPSEVDEIVAYIDERNTVVGAPYVKTEHYPVFDCAIGERADPLQRPREDDGRDPAVHLGRDLEDGQPARVGDDRRRRAALPRRVEARRQGDRDLPRQLQGRPAALGQGREGRRATLARAARRVAAPQRRRLPDDRTEIGRKFRVGEYEGYIHVGVFDDGTPGDIFVDIAKEGTTLAGLMNSFMIAVSLGLQYGVPLEVYVSKFAHMRFEPSGLTNDPDIRVAKSIVDYIFRWMGKKFLTVDQQEEVGHPLARGAGADGGRPTPPARRRRRTSTHRCRPGPDRALQHARGRDRVLPLRRPHGARRHLLHLPRLRHVHRLRLGVRDRACRRAAGRELRGRPRDGAFLVRPPSGADLTSTPSGSPARGRPRPPKLGRLGPTSPAGLTGPVAR